jgi:two-component system, chemotaxis family, sensor kinase CheA
MSLEMSQFHAAFFEEAFESLSGMEAALLTLNPGTPDAEAINSIFRVAHSIKGGAGMFSFNEITSFTHTLETLLDELRAGHMLVTSGIIDLLLKATDVLQGMLQATQHKAPIDQQTMADVQFDLEQLVVQAATADARNAPAAAQVPAPRPAATTVSAATQGPARHPRMAIPEERTWEIEFRPNERLLVQGNDPSRMFAELAELGSVRLTAHTGDVPALADLNPEVCYVHWTITLTTELSEETIRSVFEWAEGDCELRITASAAPAAEAQTREAPDTAAPPQAAEPVVADTAPARAPTPAADVPAERPPKAASSDSNSIRVAIEKIDELMNTVGEIVITQSMLMQFAHGGAPPRMDRLRTGLTQLERNVRELQESVMRVRMLPISFTFSRFPRLVRDLSQRLNKQIELRMTGEQTELDKTVLERIGDPLVHLVRNSIDHGIEMPDARIAAGKPAAGTLFLNAYHRGGCIVIEVGDDGAGLNLERILAKARAKGLVGPNDSLSEEAIANLIFLPGFSTAEVTTDLSGRGVGMDVVRRNIKELGGTVELRTQTGKGSSAIITLPLTLAIVDGQSVAVGGEVYIVPLVTIVESLQLKRGMVNRLVGRGEVFSFRGDYIPIVRLHDVFDVEPRHRELDHGLVMVVEGDGRKVGLFVDQLLGQQQVVIKSMETNYRRVEGVSGATILGEGSVALILDIPGLVRCAADRIAA